MAGTVISVILSLLFMLAFFGLWIFVFVVMIQVLLMARKIMRWYMKKNDIV